MTVLVDWEIRQLLSNDNSEGCIRPYNEEQLNPSSYDVSIGDSLLGDYIDGFRNYDNFKNTNKDNPYILHPGECVLTCTREYLILPDTVACELKLKSSRAREGLDHALAGWVDNGFHGVLTLELKNNTNNQPVKIYPGLRIGQLIFYRTTKPEKSYVNGRYSGHKKVVGSLDKW